MCGITGFIGLDDKKLLMNMTSSLSHRGPDDAGHFIDRGIGLGHRRLSIIDVKGGHQPMHNEDETIWIVFNGEIYNYIELRGKLEKKGHRFYTDCDTETIIHAYEEYGQDCPKKLRGVFAFAIWDSNKKTLFLARDRLGIKPLYYANIDGVFLFGSELKAILQYDMKRQVDLMALSDYLSFCYVPHPRTMFKNIKKVPPGCVLAFNKDVKISRYWDFHVDTSGNKTEEYYKKKIIKMLNESVRMRMMSDVPLGAFLSGGLDSSTIVAMMSQSTSDPVKTFSAVFEEGSYYDESKYARMISERFETDHHEIMLNVNDAKLLPKVIWHTEEPVPDSSLIPRFLLDQKAKKHVKVILAGEGGDELFVGYRQYKIMRSAYRYQGILPSFVKNTVPYVLLPFTKMPVMKVRRYSKMVSDFVPTIGNPKESYKSLMQSFTEKEKRDILPASTETNTLNKYFKNKNFLEDMYAYELKVRLNDNFLLNVNKTSMANSIEIRVPFLDHKLIEFSSTIPMNLKLRGTEEKYIFKKAISNILPKEILERDKHPFAVSTIEWLENELKDTTQHLLSKENIKNQGCFNYRYIEKILRNKNYNHIWTLLFFGIWHKIFIEESNINKIII